MSRLFISCIVSILFLTAGYAQITTEPALPVAAKEVLIIFNSAQESRLGYFTGDLYAHTGVGLEGEGNWKNVIGTWGNNAVQPKLTHKGNGIFELRISPDLYAFYSVAASKKILNMSFVFRSGDGSKQTNDLFVNVYAEGLFVQFSRPADNSVLFINTPAEVSVNSSLPATISLFLDQEMITQSEGKSLDYSVNFTEGGNHWLIARATLGSDTRYDSVYVTVQAAVPLSPKPVEYRKGINYISDNTVALVLWAPQKNYVYAVGDFNEWRPDNAYLMNKDGDYFWIQVDQLDPGKPYVFQYYIDSELWIADPYTEQTSDPLDKSIPDVTYPGLVAYPEGKANGVASVLQTGQLPYNWEVNDFSPVPADKMVIYEMLIRDFTEARSYKAVIEKLDYLKTLNVNVLELMPVNEFEWNESWGYNPSFYFAPDKFYGPKNELKRLIDEAHKRGMAVVLDMVLNHSYGQSPLVRMYQDKSTGRPAANNPWYNQQHNFQNPDAHWGSDFNHESIYTRALIDSINSFWIREYKVDGFRFDFTKGFSNTPFGPGDWGSAYDAARIANLKRMADEIRKRKSDAIIIFEHLADNSEERELANYGILLWGNMNGSYRSAAKGFSSDLSWGLHQSRNWQVPHLITYMESHDEERVVYDCLQAGLNSGAYDTRNFSIAIDRMKLNSVFLLPLPGPKMIWQFGELGYDYSINYNGRLGIKPVVWNYTENPVRYDLYKTKARLNYLKQTYDEFSAPDYQGSLNNPVKWYRLSKGGNHVVVIGNFGLTAQSVTVNFPVTGTWHDYFSGTTYPVIQASQSVNLAPGQYKLYSTRKFNDPFLTNTVQVSAENNDIQVYPNPAARMVNIRSGSTITGVEIRDISGQVLFSGQFSDHEISIPLTRFSPGLYVVSVVRGNVTSHRKLLIQR
jgi:1,4-alpha-glucan branching enzyme